MSPSTPLILVCFMAVVAMSSFPTTHAQTRLFGIIRINGTVLCAVNATLTPTAPAFPNATVQLRCLGIVVATTLTNPAGNFNLTLGPLRILLADLLNNCAVVVATPLVQCNATLPASTGGLLTSTLRCAGTSVTRLGTRVLNLIAAVFAL